MQRLFIATPCDIALTPCVWKMYPYVHCWGCRGYIYNLYMFRTYTTFNSRRSVMKLQGCFKEQILIWCNCSCCQMGITIDENVIIMLCVRKGFILHVNATRVHHSASKCQKGLCHHTREARPRSRPGRALLHLPLLQCAAVLTPHESSASV
jgi:hypothetical protein